MKVTLCQSFIFLYSMVSNVTPLKLVLVSVEESYFQKHMHIHDRFQLYVHIMLKCRMKAPSSLNWASTEATRNQDSIGWDSITVVYPHILYLTVGIFVIQFPQPTLTHCLGILERFKYSWRISWIGFWIIHSQNCL